MKKLKEVVVFNEGKRIKVSQISQLIGKEDVEILYYEQGKWKSMQGKFIKYNVFWRKNYLQ